MAWTAPTIVEVCVGMEVTSYEFGRDLIGRQPGVFPTTNLGTNVRIIVLGSAAGGGFPQWNCLCPVCRLAWNGDKRVKPRTQSSLAVSSDGEHWLLLNASPDLRQQIIATPQLHPRGASRQSPIAAVFVTNGDVDHLTGLLTLREQQSFTIFGSKATLAEVADGRIFGVLNRDLVHSKRVALGRDGRYRPRSHSHALCRAWQSAALS